MSPVLLPKDKSKITKKIKINKKKALTLDYFSSENIRARDLDDNENEIETEDLKAKQKQKTKSKELKARDSSEERKLLYELDIREKLEKLRERQKARKEKKARKELKKKLKEQKKQMLALEFAREYKKKNGDEDNEDEGDIPNLNRVVRDSAPRSILVQGKDKV